MGRLGTVVLLMALAACGAGEDGADDGAAKDAAEPAAAPELTVPPAGTTNEVAPEPQGLVYDVRSDSLAVAVRDPNRLLILDPTTLDPTLSVPLPGKVRHLQTTRDRTVLLCPECAPSPDPRVRTTDRGARCRQRADATALYAVKREGHPAGAERARALVAGCDRRVRRVGGG